MSIQKKSRIFDGLDPVNEAGIDEWKMERMVEATAGYLIDLAGRWDISVDGFGDRPVEVRVVNDRGSVGDDGIELSDPDLYRAVMRSNYDDSRVLERVDRDYPVPFHQVPEEVGQLIGDRTDNSWSFDEGFDSVARDELHGDLAKMEYFPWFVELEKDVWERDLHILMKMNGEEEIQYLEEVGDDLAEATGQGRGEVESRLREAVMDTPTDDLVNMYNTKYELSPQPLSRTVLAAYSSADLDEVPKDYEVADEDSEWSPEGLDEAMKEVGSLEYDELAEVRDSSLEYDSMADRAYLAAARLAEDISESEQLMAGEVIKSDDKTDRYISRRLHEEDKRIRSQMDL